jgi:hypothetical protein
MHPAEGKGFFRGLHLLKAGCNIIITYYIMTSTEEVPQCPRRCPPGQPSRCPAARAPRVVDEGGVRRPGGGTPRRGREHSALAAGLLPLGLGAERVPGDGGGRAGDLVPRHGLHAGTRRGGCAGAGGTRSVADVRAITSQRCHSSGSLPKRPSTPSTSPSRRSRGLLPAFSPIWNTSNRPPRGGM